MPAPTFDLALTGTAPDQVASVTQLEEAINAALAFGYDQSLRKGGELSNGVDLNTVRQPGVYFLNADAGYVNGPAFVAGEAYHLIVHAHGNSVGNGDTRMVRQELVSRRPTDGYIRDHWERTFDRDNPTSSGTHWTRPSRAGTEVAAQRGNIVSGTDLNTIRAPGFYTIPAGVTLTNGPALNSTQAYQMEVHAGGNSVGIGDSRFPRQIIRQINGDAGPRLWMERTFDRDGTPSDPRWQWRQVGGTTTGTGASRLAGKTAVIFGDSITEGSASYTWPPRLATQTGMTVINGGFGGARMAVHDEPTVGTLYDPFSMYRLSERIKNNDWSVLTAAADALFTSQGDDNRPQAAALAAVNWADVDFIVIAYGTNDFRGTSGMGVPIGANSDATGATFKGAINVTIQNILDTYPHIQILFVTPLWRSRVAVSGEDSNVTANGSGVFLRDYVQAIKDRAAPYQIPVADLHANSGMNILNWEAYMPDGLHPYTDAGMQRVADFVAAQMEAVF